MTGEWPQNTIDHRNGIRTDNRWANLRAATQSQNNQNRETKGYYFDKKANRYRVSLENRVKGKRIRIYVGVFLTEREARTAYLRAFKERFGGDYMDRKAS